MASDFRGSRSAAAPGRLPAQAPHSAPGHGASLPAAAVYPSPSGGANRL